MANFNKKLQAQRQRRRFHVRNQLSPSDQRLRLAVFRSHKHMYCQVIDDEKGVTVASASTRDKDLRSQIKYGGNRDAAAIVGKTIAQKALAQGVQQVCFDRGSYKYHGRVAALADAAREGGLQF